MISTKPEQQTVRLVHTGNADNQIIVIPGGPGLTLEYLKPFHDHLTSDSYEVISYDPAGTVTSKKPSPEGITDLAEELDQLVNQIKKGGKLIMIGHSVSASVVLEYAINSNQPDVIILSNGFVSGQDLRLAYQKRSEAFGEDFNTRYADYRRNRNPESLWSLMHDYWIPNYFFRYAPPTEEMQVSLANFSLSDVPAKFIGEDFFDMQGAFIDWTAEERLDQLSCQVHLFSGTNDYMDFESLKSMQAKFKEATLDIIPNTSHSPFIENPDGYFKSIKSYLP